VKWGGRPAHGRNQSRATGPVSKLISAHVEHGRQPQTQEPDLNRPSTTDTLPLSRFLFLISSALLIRTLAFSVFFLWIGTGCSLFRLIRRAGALILARFVF
jgi:hypothetical protein